MINNAFLPVCLFFSAYVTFIVYFFLLFQFWMINDTFLPVCLFFSAYVTFIVYFFYCFNLEWLITLFKDFAYCTHWGAHSALVPFAKFYFPIHAKHRIFFLPG